MSISNEQVRSAAIRLSGFLGKRNEKHIKHWWEMYFITHEREMTQTEWNGFLLGMYRVFEHYIVKNEFSHLKELFDILGRLHPNMPSLELDQLRYVLLDKGIRDSYLNIYLHEGKAQTLLTLIDETFGSFVEANATDPDIAWYWRDIHEQLAGIMNHLPIDDY